MPKFAPANEDGDKPYVVEGKDWGRNISRVVWADGAPSARYAVGLRGVGQYVTKVRRATTDDLADSGNGPVDKEN